jgi:hypothetical protein
MAEKDRKELISKIESKRGTKLISYITSDREGLGVGIAGDVVSIIHNHILSLGSSGDDLKLDLFLYSRGGHSDVPWALVSMFREYASKGSFSVLIPYRAHSAATVISLGADEIIMTKKAELGPIDITINSGPYNPTEKDSHRRLPISVEDVTGYFSLLKTVGCSKSNDKTKGFELLTNKVHPLALGSVSRLLEQTKLVGLRLLSTRAHPFRGSENRAIIKALSSEVYSHSHSINRTEAIKYLKLKQVKKAEDCNIDQELWALYEQYKELFQLENPYKPEEYLIEKGLEAQTWPGLNLACVESLNRIDICKMDQRVVRLRKVPPQLNINLGNVALPTINIPALPATINKQQIEAIIQKTAATIIQQTLNSAADSAVKQLLKSLPQAGFERISFNAGWF